MGSPLRVVRARALTYLALNRVVPILNIFAASDSVRSATSASDFLFMACMRRRVRRSGRDGSISILLGCCFSFSRSGAREA